MPQMARYGLRIFWSFSGHRYQTQSLLTTISDARGQRMTYVIDNKFNDNKKQNIEHFD